MYENQYPEQKVESAKNFERELEKHGELPLNNKQSYLFRVNPYVEKFRHRGIYLAIETGATDRFRRGRILYADGAFFYPERAVSPLLAFYETCSLDRPLGLQSFIRLAYTLFYRKRDTRTSSIYPPRCKYA